MSLAVPDSAPGALDKIDKITSADDITAVPNKERDLPDAGLRSLDHSYFQGAVRTPFLDSYFAISANLGTHTFYMVGLPLLFWCGYASYGKA
ncbi:unnamed protein product [Parascedosporium putredinis]|uniref:Uncharacterized protein n=1 Tax=Parascedosporium putredinis TaxID=1442378 RepID=A0A9P1H729_9PEZI|nr:unnamed protein product [Parascedosporium putredinis]CAI7999447.1 unnamed protein product [Parascedosporium putredinis]